MAVQFDRPITALTMGSDAMPDAGVTRLIRQLADGRKSAADELLPLIYDELRALAECYLRHERAGHTLQATALVHEAYLKLVDQQNVQWHDRTHFFAVAARAIRRILVDHARGRGRSKRGGGQSAVGLDEATATELNENAVDLLALDEAMKRLGEVHERQARVVELRYFGGLGLDEVADVLHVSPSTVDGDWAMARAWLRRALRDGGPE